MKLTPQEQAALARTRLGARLDSSTERGKHTDRPTRVGLSRILGLTGHLDPSMERGKHTDRPSHVGPSHMHASLGPKQDPNACPTCGRIH